MLFSFFVAWMAMIQGSLPAPDRERSPSPGTAAAPENAAKKYDAKNEKAQKNEATQPAMPAASNPSLAALNRFAARFGLDRQKSAHLFVIDFSGSMLWPPVRGARGPAPKTRRNQPPAPTRWDVLLGALPTLLDAIPAGDWVWVIGFHEKMVEDSAWVFSAWEGAKSRDFLIRSLRAQQDFGNWTNVGLALRRAKEILKNAEPRIQNVYLLTDGMHDVPETDEFHDRAGAAWKNLAADWDGLFRDNFRTLLFSMYGLFDVADFRDVKSVIPKLKFLAFSGAGDLNLVFREQVDTALANRVSAFLERERDRGRIQVELEPADLLYSRGQNRFTFRLASTFSTLPARGKIALEILQKPEDPAFGLQLETDSFLLEPGRKTEVGVKVQAGVPSAWFHARKTERAAFRIVISDVQLEPGADFDTAGLASLRTAPNAAAAANGTLHLQIEYGRWPLFYKTLALALAILLALTALYLAWRLRPRRIRGHIEWVTHPNRDWKHGDITAFDGKASVRLGAGSGCHVRLEGFPSLFVIIHNRPRGLFGRQLVMEAGCLGLSRNERPFSIGRKEIIASSAIYEYQDSLGNKIEFKIILTK